jgi:hypothetical protein
MLSRERESAPRRCAALGENGLHAIRGRLTASALFGCGVDFPDGCPAGIGGGTARFREFAIRDGFSFHKVKLMLNRISQ